MMHRMTHALIRAYLIGLGQSYIGGRSELVTERSGLLANIGRCMGFPPPALACAASAGCYRVNAKRYPGLLNSVFIAYLSYHKIDILCVNSA
jgi:hypothetical protein